MSEPTLKTLNWLTGHGSDVACIILIVAATEAHIIYFTMVPTQASTKRKYVLAGRGRLCQHVQTEVYPSCRNPTSHNISFHLNSECDVRTNSMSQASLLLGESVRGDQANAVTLVPMWNEANLLADVAP